MTTVSDMDEEDIKELFDRVAKQFEGADEGTHAMFSMLVSTALRYRDMLVHSTGQPLTVVETREALDAFIKVVKTHDIPVGLEKRVHGLVMMWLEELRERIHH
ncbi:MAG: hypothetical protein WC956_08600 [bacterium]